MIGGSWSNLFSGRIYIASYSSTGLVPACVVVTNSAKSVPSCKLNDAQETSDCCLNDDHRVEAASRSLMNFIPIAFMSKSNPQVKKTTIDLKE